MHYCYEVVVEKTNTAQSPVIFPVVLGAGIVRRVQIVFRLGCDKRVRVKLYDGSKQILPTNPEGYYALDGDIVDVQFYYDLSKEYNELFLVAWAYNAKLSHTLTVMIDVDGPDEPNITASLKYLANAIHELVAYARSNLI